MVGRRLLCPLTCLFSNGLLALAKFSIRLNYPQGSHSITFLEHHAILLLMFGRSLNLIFYFVRFKYAEGFAAHGFEHLLDG